MDTAILFKDLLIALAEILGAGAVVFGGMFAIYRWVLKQNNQDDDIKALKEEQTVICYGVLAALQGLKEQGCNGPVTKAIENLEKHLNKKAHK